MNSLQDMKMISSFWDMKGTKSRNVRFSDLKELTASSVQELQNEERESIRGTCSVKDQNKDAVFC